MDHSQCSVVSLDVHEDNSTVLNIRVNNQWVHLEANKSDLKNKNVRQHYERLVEHHRRQEEGKDEYDLEAQSATAGTTSRDSGYLSDERADVATSTPDNKPKTGRERDLSAWLFDALDQVHNDFSKDKQNPQPLSLAAWYDSPIYCYSIHTGTKSEEVTVTRRDDLNGEDYVRTHLTPHIELPKYLRRLKGVPWYRPEDIRVEDEADDIHLSAHPTQISALSEVVPEDLRQHSDAAHADEPSRRRNETDVHSHTRTSTKEAERTTYFLKLATSQDSAAVKREIRFLHLLMKNDLYGKGIRAPRIAGLVSLPGASEAKSSSSSPTPSRLLGFLLTLIPQPTTPLTHLITPFSAENLRSEYASQIKAMVDVLHKHDLVWGDAKADNFLVDGKGDLWMIDFGGSYTPGWIDEELADTIEGDNMATEKIVHALEDPIHNVEHEGTMCSVGPEQEDAEAQGISSQSQDETINTKRKRSIGSNEMEPSADDNDIDDGSSGLSKSMPKRQKASLG